MLPTSASKANSDKPRSTKAQAQHSEPTENRKKKWNSAGYLDMQVFQETNLQINKPKKLQDGLKK